jgi:hypothetical protein
MNELFLFDNDQVPQPRKKIKITSLTAEPYPDGARVKTEVRITPFQDRPNLELYAKKVDGPIVAEMSVIETMTPNLDFTMHIRGIDELAGDYILRAELYYEERTDPQHTVEITFRIETENQPDTNK